VHDAVLICTPVDRMEANITAMRAAMAEAARVVLAGFELGTDVKIVRWPARYMDGRGAVMWDRVTKLSGRQEQRLTA
jgi:DNA polymerase I